MYIAVVTPNEFEKVDDSKTYFSILITFIFQHDIRKYKNSYFLKVSGFPDECDGCIFDHDGLLDSRG